MLPSISAPIPTTGFSYHEGSQVDFLSFLGINVAALSEVRLVKSGNTFDNFCFPSSLHHRNRNASSAFSLPLLYSLLTNALNHFPLLLETPDLGYT